MPAHWEGLGPVMEAFAKVSAQADLAARSIVAKAAAEAEKQAKAGFSGSHAKGEPHVGGNKPNIVTGNLRRSIKHDPVHRDGIASYGTTVGPTAVYGRRVELGYAGGGGGPGHQRTRPFPYFEPGARRAQARFDAIAAAEWGRFLLRR